MAQICAANDFGIKFLKKFVIEVSKNYGGHFGAILEKDICV